MNDNVKVLIFPVFFALSGKLKLLLLCLCGDLTVL